MKPKNYATSFLLSLTNHNSAICHKTVSNWNEFVHMATKHLEKETTQKMGVIYILKSIQDRISAQCCIIFDYFLKLISVGLAKVSCKK